MCVARHRHCPVLTIDAVSRVDMIKANVLILALGNEFSEIIYIWREAKYFLNNIWR